MENQFLKQFAELEAIARRGAVVIVKLDGVRALAKETDVYTVMLSGGELESDEFFRKDGANLPDLIQLAVDFYNLHKPPLA